MDSQLRATLVELHEALEHLGPLDDEANQLLAVIAHDIRRLAIQPESLSIEQISPMTRQLNDLALQFESKHPQLTVLFGRLAESLANLGI